MHSDVKRLHFLINFIFLINNLRKNGSVKAVFIVNGVMISAVQIFA